MFLCRPQKKKKTTLSDQIKGRVENVSTGWRIFFFFIPYLALEAIPSNLRPGYFPHMVKVE